MKKILKSLALTATTVLALTACTNKSETTAVNDFHIQRGTNLSHWLSQSEERGEARAKHIQEDDFARLDSLGFDFVRIPIDEVQFWDEEGNKLPEAWDLLTFALDQCGKHHLRAIVDLHTYTRNTSDNTAPVHEHTSDNTSPGAGNCQALLPPCMG